MEQHTAAGALLLTVRLRVQAVLVQAPGCCRLGMLLVNQACLAQEGRLCSM